MSSPSPPIGSPAAGGPALVPPAALAGLSSQEAAALLERYGPNEPAPAKRSAVFVELVFLFLNPLVIILLVACLASFILGDASDAFIILFIVLLGVLINFVQSYRSQRAIERIRADVAPTATVLRDGQWRELGRREVVPGDVVRVAAGDLIPADGELREARDLYVQQAALTGESMPVEKSAHAGADANSKGPDAPNLVFLGTSVVSGTGIAVIAATGAQTSFGAIAARLATRPPETDFERSMRQFAVLIMRAVFFLVLFILSVRIALHKDAFESFLFAVALAVGLTPEFLPMIASVTLARGAVRMAREHVIVKHLPAIQNLGTVDIFCSDKTGTLTTGLMTLDRSVDYCGAPTDRAIELATLNSKFETGIRSPLDDAILKAGHAGADDYVKCDEIPFDFERRRLSIVVEKKTPGDGRLLITKGAPEGILDLSDSYEVGGRVVPFDPALRRHCRETFNDLSAQGFRVLAVAYRSMDGPGPYSVKDERALVFVGYLAFADPPSPDAAESLAEMKRDGVTVKILTGDNELVSRHICEQVGIQNPAIVLGDDLETMEDPALQNVAERTDVFARVSPVQKHRIILALKHRGHVVGYMGDGINDAPSLHAADVGISVSTAVDVAREAADIILVKPGLRVLAQRHPRGPPRFGQRDEVSADGHQLEFRQHVQHGGGFAVSAVSADAAHANPAEQFPVRRGPDHHPVRQRGPELPARAAEVGYEADPQFHGVHRAHQLDLRFSDLLRAAALLPRRPTEFHTGWFVESLATQTLVLFVIRTMQNPLRSRPSAPLAITTILIVILGIWLPYSPLAHRFGFTPLPGFFFIILAIFTITYLLLVEVAKRLLFSRAEI